MRRLTAALLFAATAAGVASLPVAPLGAMQKKKAPPPASPSPALDVPLSQGAKALLPLPKDAAGVWASAGTVTDGKLALPADAAVGTRWVRAATAGGATAPRPVTLDLFPEVAEEAKNRARETPQELPVPCVVTGKADAEARAFFKLAVAKGKPLALEVLARRLGSPFDPVIVLYHPDGRTVPGAYADDTPGLMGDARVVWTPPADGTVVAEVRDSTYKGGPEFTYRLRVGDFPGATTAFPLAVQRGQTATVSFTGPHVGGVGPVTLVAPADPSVEAVSVVPTRGAPGWPVWVKLSDSPQTVEQEPNDSPAAANLLANPGGVSARFAAPKDVDHFRFSVAKGQRYLVSILTHELNSPAEVLLKVLDPAGKEVGQSDPTQPACKVEFTAAADGEGVAVCEHQNYLHGPTEVYHLSVRPLLPDFAVTLASDRLSLPAGGVGLLTGVKLDRLNGFTGPVTLAVVGDGLSGSGAAELPLGVTAAADVKPGLRTFKLKATGTVNGVEVVRFASVTEPVRAALNGIPVVPPELANTVAVAVRPAVPFGLSVAVEPAAVGQGGKLKATVTLTRAADFDEPVTLTLLNPPAGVSAKPATVAKGATTAMVEVSVAADAAVGPAAVVVKGTAGSHEAVTVPAVVTVAKKDKK